MYDNEKMCRLRDLSRDIALVEGRFADTFGLSLHEAMLLCCLHENEGLTAGEVGQTLALTQSTASKVIRSLERQKFLRRRLDREDKRVMHYSLTPSGEEKLRSLDCSRIEMGPLLERVLQTQ